MAGMWRLYGQAVGSLLHPVRTIRELRTGILPLTHAASLRPVETGLALREAGVDLAALFRLIYWISIAELIVEVVAPVSGFPALSWLAMVGMIVVSPLVVAVVFAVFLPVIWYWWALAVRIGFRAVGPWMSWQEARALIVAGWLPQGALWVVGLWLLLQLANLLPGVSGAAAEGSWWLRVPGGLLGLFTLLQGLRVIAGLRGLSALSAFGGYLLSLIVCVLPVVVVSVAVGIIGAVLRGG